MPCYQNISPQSLMMPSLEEKGGEVTYSKNEIFLGAQKTHGSFVGLNPPIIKRISQGIDVNGVESSGSILFSLPYPINENECIACSIDISGSYGSILTINEKYAAWGKIEWSDDSTTGSYALFKVIGNGTHGSGSTFTLGSKTALPDKDQASASLSATGAIIDCSQGTISIPFTGDMPTSVFVNIVFEPLSAGQFGRYGRSRNPFTAPLYTSRNYYVVAGDVSDDYDAASVGKIKVAKKFLTGARIGDPCHVTKYLYRQAGIAEPTHTLSFLASVEEEDLI